MTNAFLKWPLLSGSQGHIGSPRYEYRRKLLNGRGIKELRLGPIISTTAQDFRRQYI